MPGGVLQTIWERNKHDVHRGDIITPTSLPRCKRKLKLERTREYYGLPQQLYWAVRGGLYHGWLERPRPGILTETRLWKKVTFGPMAPYWISGCFDYYDIAAQSLEDYKSQSDKGTYYLFNDGFKEEHAAQLNVYRWCMNGGFTGVVDEHGVPFFKEDTHMGEQVFLPVKSMVIHNVFMNQVISTGKIHHERVTSYKAPNYGKKWGMEVGRKQVGESQRGVPIWDIELDIPSIPMWEDAKVEQYISDNAPELVQAFREENYMPVGVMNDPDNNWECKLCALRRECLQIEETNATKEQAA